MHGVCVWRSGASSEGEALIVKEPKGVLAVGAKYPAVTFRGEWEEVFGQVEWAERRAERSEHEKQRNRTIGEPVRLEWFNPQGERILPSKRMALHSETSRSRLIIYNAIIEDAGIYRCQATDANGHTEEASVVLEIYQRLTFRDVQSPQEFRHGETAEVVCDVISSPVPVVVWYYQDQEITEEHHTLDTPSSIETKAHIHQVTKADEGVYRCEASVEARGEIDFVDIAMVVNGEFHFESGLAVKGFTESLRIRVPVMFRNVAPIGFRYLKPLH
ncbi:hypothetical protein KUCAC02_024870, partial [Chaenocephalus aceratus]